MYADQFAPGFAGLVAGIPVAVAVVIVLFIQRRRLIHWYYSIKAMLLDTADDIHQAREEERTQRKKENDW